MRVVGVLASAGLAGMAIPAMGGVVSVNFWDVRAGYGVFADGGSGGVPDQGYESLGVGSTSRSWSQDDGVAHARAGVESVIALDTSGGLLDLSIDFRSSAWAEVGDNPSYAWERGVGEAWLESVLVDITVLQGATLEVSGAPLGSFGVGTHTLSPGNYLLDLTGPLARSAVDVGPLGSGFDERSLQVSMRIVPGASTGVALAMACAARRRRR